jgi:amino-acid N-acetyltransferase
MKKETVTSSVKRVIRKALIKDVKELQKLINRFAEERQMLSRSLSELYDNVRDFYVCQIGEKLVGACALHVIWEDLAEIKSLAVLPEFQRQGIGSSLTRACLEEAQALQIKQVFTLTEEEEFFRKIGFEIADKNVLPQKVWGECVKCYKFPDCNEVAMIYQG